MMCESFKNHQLDKNRPNANDDDKTSLGIAKTSITSRTLLPKIAIKGNEKPRIPDQDHQSQRKTTYDRSYNVDSTFFRRRAKQPRPSSKNVEDDRHFVLVFPGREKGHQTVSSILQPKPSISVDFDIGQSCDDEVPYVIDRTAQVPVIKSLAMPPSSSSTTRTRSLVCSSARPSSLEKNAPFVLPIRPSRRIKEQEKFVFPEQVRPVFISFPPASLIDEKLLIPVDL